MLKNIPSFSLALLFSLALFGCSASKENSLSASQLDSEVNAAQKTTPDSSVERSSEAMRHFLMAELSMSAEQSDAALNNLKKSSELVNTPDPQIQINLALLYLEKGEPKQALKELNDITTDPQVLELKASLMQILGDQSGSLDIYRKLLEVQSDSVEAKLMLSLKALQSREAAQALPLLESIISKDSKHLPAIKLLAFTYSELGNNERAVSLLEQIRQIDPGDSNAFKLLLALALENHKFDIIEREIAREIKLNPSNQIILQFKSLNWKDPNDAGAQTLARNLKTDSNFPPTASDLRYEIARLALLKQDFSEAVVQFSLLLAEKPEDDELRYTLALALSSSGRPKEAISHLESFDSDSLWYVRAQAFAGMLNRQKGDYKLAEQSFRRALQADPKSEQLQAYLASVLHDAGKFEAAAKVYKDLLKSDPDNQKILFSYGSLLSEMGEDKESSKIMQKLIGLNPQHAEALNFLAYSLAEEGKELDRALDLSNRAIQLQPDNGFFIDTRGWIYFRKGLNAEAVKDLERAVDLSKADAEISEHLADVYLKEGRKSDAIKVYKVALDALVDSKEESDKISVQRIKKKIEELSKISSTK